MSEHSALLPIRVREWDVFISHAREDAPMARALSVAIESHGLTTWLDIKLKGEEPIDGIARALETSGAVVVLLSPAALTSRWVHREIAAALATLPRGSVIPIAVGDIDVRHLPPPLADRKWLHLRDAARVERLVRQLMPILEATLGTSDTALGTAKVIGDMPARVPVVGAESYLRTLRASSIGITWIVGMAGIGKTSLAREFAFQARQDMNEILWLNGRQASASDLVLRIEEWSIETRSQGQALVVVDELDALPHSAERLLSLLERLGSNNRVLITTRKLPHRVADHRRSSVVVVGPLSDEAAAAYLESVAPELSPQTRTEAVHLAGGTPMLLRLLAEVLRQHDSSELSLNTWSPTGALSALLRLLLTRLSSKERQRTFVLAYCGDLIAAARADAQWELPGDDALYARLTEWGICGRRGTRVVIHEGIVDLLRSVAPRDALEDAIAYVLPRLPDPSDPEALELLPGVATLTDFSELAWSRHASAELSELLIWQASVWRTSAEPVRAQALCERAQSLAAESGETLLQSRAMSLRAALAFDQGHLDEAIDVERRVVDIVFRDLGSDHPASMSALSNLATTLHARGDLPEAITLLRHVVQWSRKSLPDGDPDSVAAMGNLAICLRDAGLHQEALSAISAAVSESRTGFRRCQLEQTLAAVLLDMGQHNEAAAILETTLANTELDSPMLLSVRTNLATVYANLGRFEEALDIQSEVVDQAEILNGPDHFSTLNALTKLGVLLSQTGSHRRASVILRDAVSRRTRVQGADHPESLQAELLLGKTLSALGDREEAASLYSDLARRVGRVLGPEHPMALAVREELAKELQRKGDYAAAQISYRELLADLDRLVPVDHPMRLRVHEAIGAPRPARDRPTPPHPE